MKCKSHGVGILACLISYTPRIMPSRIFIEWMKMYLIIYKYGFSIIDLLSGKPINDINILKHISKYSKNTTRPMGDEMNQYLKGSGCTLLGSASVWSWRVQAQWVTDGDKQTVWDRGWEQRQVKKLGTGKNMKRRANDPAQQPMATNKSVCLVCKAQKAWCRNGLWL